MAARAVIAYRLLLGAFPAAFRDRFGRDMTDVFTDRWRAASRRGPGAKASLIWRTVLDLSSALWREWRREWTRHRTWRPRMLVTDSKHAWRLIARRPGFSLTVMLIVALGVGATTSVFTVSNALVLRALPYAHADRLVRLFEHEDVEGFSGSLALGNLDDWCSAPGLDACGAYVMSDVNLAGGDSPDRVRAATATPGLFDALSVRPLSGRIFSRADADTKAPVILISEPARARLIGAADPIGRSLLLDGVRFDVIGVVPAIPGFDDVAVWRAASSAGQSRQNHANRGIARLGAGVTLAVAQQQLDAVSRRLQHEIPATNAHWWGRIEPLQESLTSNFSQTLSALGGLTAVLLLLCAVSAASLVAGRSAGRQRELSVRLALGAPHSRLVAQLFIESLALAVGGAALGALFAVWTVRAVVAVLPPRLVLWRTPGIDVPTLLFAAGVAIAASAIFGLTPAIGLVRRSSALGSLQTRSTAAGGRRLRSVLIALQTGLALVLLVAAALLGSVLVRVLTVDPGFRTNQVLTFNVTTPRATYADNATVNAFFDNLTARLSRLPQIESLGASINTPMSGSGVVRGVIRVGEPIPPRGSARLVLFQVSTPGYLKALDLRLVDGRDFTDDDTAGSEPVALVNQRLASALWPDQRAVGQQLIAHTDEQTPRRVVGVLANARQSQLENAVSPEYYVPFRQSPRRTMSYVLHLRGELTRQQLQSEISAVDPSLPLYELSTLDGLMTRSTASRVAVTRLSIFFGAAALLLAATGLFGLVASSVADRTREIGVRVALGASAGRVLRLVMWHGLSMTAIGAAAGLAGAIPVVRLLKGLLGATPPSNVLTTTLALTVLIVVALIACWMPARAALDVDPAASLRAE